MPRRAPLRPLNFDRARGGGDDGFMMDGLRGTLKIPRRRATTTRGQDVAVVCAWIKYSEKKNTEQKERCYIQGVFDVFATGMRPNGVVEGCFSDKRAKICFRAQTTF